MPIVYQNISLDEADIQALISSFGGVFIQFFKGLSIIGVIVFIMSISSMSFPRAILLGFMAWIVFSFFGIGMTIITQIWVFFFRKKVIEGLIQEKGTSPGKQTTYWVVINNSQYEINKSFWKTIEIDMEVRLHKSNFFYYFIRGEIIS